MDAPRTRLSAAVFDSRDPRAHAGFYQRLLGWHVEGSEDADPDEPPQVDWVTIRSGPGATGLSFQYEENVVRPVWPATPGEQQMVVHLDIEVDDIDVAVAFAEQLGATVANQDEDLTVMLDPEGHPFCLFRGAV